MLNRYKTVYIPVEFPERDFIARYFLSRCIAEKGMCAVLSNRWNFEKSASLVPQGIYFDRAVTAAHKKHIQKLTNGGSGVVAMDVEAHSIFDNTDFSLVYRLDESALRNIERYLCTYKYENEKKKEKYKKHSNKFIHTGSPRLDILKINMRKVFKKEIGKIKEKYGEGFELVVLSSIDEHKEGENFWKSKKYKFRKALKKDSRQVVDSLEESKNTAREMDIKMLKWIHENGNASEYVIRPHPSSKKEKYKRMFEKVDCNYSIYPWLLCADSVIQTGCTSAVEAAALGKRVYHFGSRSVRDSFSARHLPRYRNGHEKWSRVREKLRKECKFGKKYSSKEIADILCSIESNPVKEEKIHIYASYIEAKDTVAKYVKGRNKRDIKFKYEEAKKAIDSKNDLKKSNEKWVGNTLIVKPGS